MLSSVTLALAMFTVTADGPAQAPSYRLSDYVRHVPAETDPMPAKTPAAAKNSAKFIGKSNEAAEAGKAAKAGKAPKAVVQPASGSLPVAQVSGIVLPEGATSEHSAPYAHSGIPTDGAVIIERPYGAGVPDEGDPHEIVEHGGAGCAECYQHGLHGYGHPKGCGVWAAKGLPSPWGSPGNMHHHIPYLALPKDYYYFRPYQWFHIPQQQNEVLSYGGDPRHPYANRIFKEVYEELKPPPIVPAEIEEN